LIDRTFAFDNNAFVTEPWTDILVRVLARALTVFVALVM
jgi:hypothetical protein